jgi:hypothetical protein
MPTLLCLAYFVYYQLLIPDLSRRFVWLLPTQYKWGGPQRAISINFKNKTIAPKYFNLPSFIDLKYK